MEVATSRVALVDTLPKVDAIFYKLADNFNFPIVIDPARLKLHEKRLGRTFSNFAELGAEAAVSGWTTEILLIETTNICTFKCLYCPQDIMQRKKERLPLPTVKKIIEEYASNAIGTLGFHVMGEPTTNPDLPEIIGLAAKFHIGHALITNASILKRETAEDLFRRGLRHIMVSVQTFTNEQHKTIKRPAPKYDYETIMQNVKDIILAKWAIAPNARLEIHVMDNSIYRPQGVNIVANNSDAQRVIAFWKNFIRETALEFGDASVVSNLPNQAPVDFSQITWPLGEYTLAPMVFLIFKKAGHWIQDFTQQNEFIIPVKKGVCRAVCRNFTQHRQLGILSNGDAVMCCYDYDGKTAFANIKETPLDIVDVQAEGYREQLVGNDGIPFPVCKKCLGFRIKGLDDNFSSRKQEEMIPIERAAIYFDNELNALTLMRRLTSASIEVIAFITRPNPTISFNEGNSSREGVKFYAFNQIPDEVEVVLFCPEWHHDNSVVEQMKKLYPNLMIGQVDPVALDPFRPLTPGTPHENRLIEVQRRENLLEKEVAKLREEKEILQEKLKNSFLSRIARLLKNQ
ncbi:MAG: radical SAM protein [Desulfobulbaceae bacterium]|nr:radical SAM protein [Desulfobulbaceae bacterium]